MYMLFEKLKMSCGCTLTTMQRWFICNHKIDLMLGCFKRLVSRQEFWADVIFFGTCINQYMCHFLYPTRNLNGQLHGEVCPMSAYVRERDVLRDLRGS